MYQTLANEVSKAVDLIVKRVWLLSVMLTTKEVLVEPTRCLCRQCCMQAASQTATLLTATGKVTFEAVSLSTCHRTWLAAVTPCCASNALPYAA